MSDERILVVDDEPQIRRALRTALLGHGYRVELAADGETALVALAAHPPDVVILDLAMPQVEGLEVIREARTWSTVPIIVLSAYGQERAKVEALDLGADDYLTKPFGMNELLARVRAALRRIGRPSKPALIAGEVVIDLVRRVVTRRGEAVHLTPTEYELLRVLAANADKVLTHRQLLEQAWGSQAIDSGQQLRVYITYLRRKLEDDPSRPRLILTDPGIGYRLRSDG